jgi:hypothetical protein
MKLIGLRYIKISAQRNPDFNGQVSLNTNVQFKEISKADTKDTLKIPYNFIVDYKELGKIEIEGILFVSTDSKTIKTIEKAQKEKNYKTEEFTRISNLILQKSSVKAFELEDEFGLPIHIKLPEIKFN